MEAIFASKLYKTSRRKDKIAAAISNPINVELVQQIQDYLGDEEDSEVVNTSPAADETPAEVESDSPEKFSPVSHDSSAPIDFRPEEDEASSLPEEVSHVDSAPEAPEDKEEPVPQDAPDNKDSSESSDVSKFHTPRKKQDEDESTKVEESTVVNAATALYQPPVSASCCDKIRVDAAAIKGTLNVRDDTKGVSRIFVKDNELWIYYQDKINLNSVMEPVIEVLNGTGFTNLEFNRLARTENAIVFEISCVYNDVEPIVEVKE